jgi:hypothetical protein
MFDSKYLTSGQQPIAKQLDKLRQEGIHQGPNCRYPIDRVPLSISLKRRQQPDLQARAAMCPAAPGPNALLRWAPALPYVPQL